MCRLYKESDVLYDGNRRLYKEKNRLYEENDRFYEESRRLFEEKADLRHKKEQLLANVAGASIGSATPSFTRVPEMDPLFYRSELTADAPYVYLFAASFGQEFLGLGLCGNCPFFDPTDVEEDQRVRKLWSYFSVQREQLVAQDDGLSLDEAEVGQLLYRSITVYNDLSAVPETSKGSRYGKSLGVRSDHLSFLQQVFDRNIKLNHSALPPFSFRNLNCPVGFVFDQTVPDAVLMSSGDPGLGLGLRLPLGLVEVSGSSNAPDEALRQGFAEASNVVVSLLSKGVKYDDIMVPVIASNGKLMQFGAVIVLKPSFPAAFAISHVLDLTCNKDRLEAARLLCCVIRYLRQWAYDENVKESLLSLPDQSPAGIEIKAMSLDLGVYHLKKLEDFFACTGNIQTSLFHHFSVMARLHAVIACRDLVVFPICVREYDDDPWYSCIVFPRLGEEYRIGLPETRGDRVELFAKLRSAVQAFHEAGVVHLDLFLSNILWRKGPEGGIHIKVIDWDPAHFLGEDLFASARERLYDNYRSRLRDKVMAMECANLSVGSRDFYRTQMRYFDISVIVALEKWIDDPALQARSKADLDKACYNVLNAYANASDSDG
jgi:hypothetical protein